MVEGDRAEEGDDDDTDERDEGGGLDTRVSKGWIGSLSPSTQEIQYPISME